MPSAFRRRLLPALLLSLAVLAGACSGGNSSTPDSAGDAGERFFSLWQKKDYSAMYDLLTVQAQAAISREKFVGRYEAITDEATITGIDFELSGQADSGTPAAKSNPDAEPIAVKVTIHTAFFGDIVQQNSLPAVHQLVTIPPKEGSNKKPQEKVLWRIDWKPSLIFKELDDKSLVHRFARVPKRGTIFDRNGQPLAADFDLPVVGVVPDLMTDRERTISTLAGALGMPASDVRAKTNANVPSYYFIPIKTLPFGTTDQQLQTFYDLKDLGVLVQPKTQRVYPFSDSAAHILGYMKEVSADDLKQLSAQGFSEGDFIGADGLEAQFQTELSGKRGGVLATIAPEGNIVRTIAQKDAQPAQDIYLALDINVQQAAEAALGQRVGSAVVMDPRDNSVLALASYPRFDPNGFIQGLTSDQASSLLNDTRRPFLNRPLLAAYPPGSTFKVVTGSAGLERGGYTPGSTFPCTPTWSGLGPAFVKANWQSIDRGPLTIAGGLMASCNPVFYQVALTLDGIDTKLLPQFAHDFGFGAPTGIGIDEAAGLDPTPDWKRKELGEDWFSGDTVNMGIGQGFLLATPMQIANMYSALASNADLRKPLLIKKLVTPNGPTKEFTADVIRHLPISDTTLATVREGLRRVVQDPGGTSYQVFVGARVDAAGKSGTAEDLAFGADHVFFVAFANRSNPSILALISLEEGKSGSAEAGPRVRQILETFVSS